MEYFEYNEARLSSYQADRAHAAKLKTQKRRQKRYRWRLTLALAIIGRRAARSKTRLSGS